MKRITWNKQKNEWLKQSRNISFEQITVLIEAEKTVDVLDHPTRPNQRLYIVEIDNYAVVVPVVESDTEIFFKTAFFSRKYTKRYDLGRQNG